VTPKVNNTFHIQTFTQQLELLTKVKKDMINEMALMRQQNSGMDGLRMGLIREETLSEGLYRMLKLTFYG
jgi:hypothetical protein